MCGWYISGLSPTAEALVKSGAKPVSKHATLKQKLLYLADVLGFQVQYTDFPKVSTLIYMQHLYSTHSY